MIEKVYLCGPMAGATDAEMLGWRKKFSSLWPGKCADPSSRDYRNVYFDMTNKQLAQKVVDDDLEDIDGCDALVLYFPWISFGSTCEVFYAKHVRKIPVVVINDSGSKFLSPWLVHHADAIVDSVEDAIAVLKTITAESEIRDNYVSRISTQLKKVEYDLAQQ